MRHNGKYFEGLCPSTERYADAYAGDQGLTCARISCRPSSLIQDQQPYNIRAGNVVRCNPRPRCATRSPRIRPYGTTSWRHRCRATSITRLSYRSCINWASHGSTSFYVEWLTRMTDIGPPRKRHKHALDNDGSMPIIRDHHG